MEFAHVWFTFGIAGPRTGHQSPSRWRVTSQKLPGRFTLNLVNRLLIFFPHGINFFLDCCYLQKKVISIFFFHVLVYKCSRGRSISKVTPTLKNVNQDPQGCPTIPHDHSMCLHHPVGAYLCVLSTIIFPYLYGNISRYIVLLREMRDLTEAPHRHCTPYPSKYQECKAKPHTETHIYI